MVKTFNQFLLEATKTGNYCSMRAILDDHDSMLLDTIKAGYERIDDEDLHVTLMYSLGTTVNNVKIQKVLDNQPDVQYGKVHSVSLFGIKDDICTIVLEIHSDDLQRIHNILKDMGMKPTYEDYKPHVSLYYDIPVDDAKKIVPKIENIFLDKVVKFVEPKAEPLK